MGAVVGRVALFVACATVGCRGDDLAQPVEAAQSTPLFGGRHTPKLDVGDEPTQDAPKHPRILPSGEPPRVSCSAARALLDDVAGRLAAPVPSITPSEEKNFDRDLADATLDWADPHGLWTASPDSPLAAVVRARGHRLHEIAEGKADCAAELRPIGEEMVKWMGELRAIYDAAAKEGASAKLDDDAVRDAISDGAFEDGAVTRPARDLAHDLGRRAGIASTKDGALATAALLARDRWLPALDADAWSEVILAALVRAYVPLEDPHGAWAPNEEASILYDRDLELAPPTRLWGSVTRTAVGARLDADPVAPLSEKDVVLSVDGVALAGLSAESIDQLAETPEGEEAQPRKVVVVRQGKIATLDVRIALDDDDVTTTLDPLPSQVIDYGGARALVVKILDVPDALGDDLARTLARATDDAKSAGAPLAGVLLDLRGNGGGLIEGATGALGVFLPGAPLFPLKHRDGAIETERAAEPPLEDRWAGPVAALVDSGTASAAEMIAGGLHAYRRGAIIGTDTYGKGCAQEYVDDVTGAGVLRITTLLFSMPDGSPVQRVGVHPDLLLPLPRAAGVKEHEADLFHSPPSWIGPDVRDTKRIVEIPWPAAKAIGPCADEPVCKALRALSKSPALAKK